MADQRGVELLRCSTCGDGDTIYHNDESSSRRRDRTGAAEVPVHHVCDVLTSDEAKGTWLGETLVDVTMLKIGVDVGRSVDGCLQEDPVGKGCQVQVQP